LSLHPQPESWSIKWRWDSLPPKLLLPFVVDIFFSIPTAACCSPDYGHRYMSWSWSTIFFLVCRNLHQYRIQTCQSCLGRLLKLPIVLGSNPEAVAVVMMCPSDNSWNMCLAWVSKNNSCTPCKVWVLAICSIRG
jgi:hypothetical protein